MRVKSVMVLRPVVRSLRLAPIAAALGLLAACASSAGSRPSAPVNALYGQLDPNNTGGAMLLGLNGVCIISHGSSNATAIVNAVKVATEMVTSDIVGAVAGTIRPEPSARPLR